MSLWLLVNFLQNKIQQNEETPNIIEKLTFAIEKNEQLQREQLTSFGEKYRLEIELETQNSIIEFLEDEREQRNLLAEELTLVHRSSLELQQQLRRINLKKLAYYEILVNEMRRQQEWKEMEEVFQQKQEMCEQMENRNIVKQLRCKQNELKVSAAECKEAQDLITKNCDEANKKFEVSRQKRNEMVVCLVKDSKELNNLREEINRIVNGQDKFKRLQEKKIELNARLQKLQNSRPLLLQSLTAAKSVKRINDEGTMFKCPQVTSAQKTENPWRKSIAPPPAIDPFNPMAFLKTFDIKLNFDHAKPQIFLPHQQQSQRIEELKTRNNELRPILKVAIPEQSSNTATRNKVATLQEQQNTARHVHFAEPDSSNPTSPTCSSPTLSLDTLKDNKCHDIKQINDGENVANNMLSVEGREITDTAEVIDLLTPLSQKSATGALAKSSSVVAETTSESVAEILECKTIKPAGSVLLRTLPTNSTLTPSNTSNPFDLLSESEQTEQEATPASEFSIATLKTPTSVESNNTLTAVKQALDDFFKKPQEKKFTSKKAQPDKQARSEVMDFESMFLSNTSPQSEEENDLLSASEANAMIGLGNTEALESDEAEGLIFSDNEWLSKGTEASNDDFL